MATVTVDGADARAPARRLVTQLREKARAARSQEGMDACITHLQKAALVAQSAGDGALVVECLVECAESYLPLHEFAMAERFLERARELAKESGSPEMRGEVYRGFAALYRARGDLQSAAVCADRALEAIERAGASGAHARALVEIGEVYLRGQRADPAREALGRAHALGEEAEAPLRVRILLNLGLLARSSGDREVALSNYAAAASVARANHLAFECELACIGLAALYEEAGRYHDALTALREALALSAVACVAEGLEAIEGARLRAMGKRLLSIERRAADPTIGTAHRRGLDDAVRLYNIHPLVVTLRAPSYSGLDAQPMQGDSELVIQTLAAEASTQTLISGAPHRAEGASPFGRE